MSGRPDPRRLRALLAAATLLAATAGSAWADGDGSAMFGIPAADGTAPSCAVPSAKAEAPVAPPAPIVTVSASALRRIEESLARVAEEESRLAEAVPVVPPAPPAPRVFAATRTRTTRVARTARRERVELDTTIVVRPGTRFQLHNFGGEIALDTWAKNAVRVRAEHARRDWIRFRQRDGVLTAESGSTAGPTQSIEYRLTLPAWMPVVLTGVYNDVTADGMEGGLTVETVRGDIAVKRVAGAIDLRSVEGMVDVAEAKGSVRASSVNDGVRLLRVAGDVQAEAVNGDIQLIDLTSRRVDATTVNGAVLYDGRFFDDGTYRFSTHSGDIALALTDRSNATVSVATYAGEFESPFPIRLSRSKPGKRFTFALGNGKAQIDLESFQGAIQLFRPGDPAVLARFEESWQESERERGQHVKWIWKSGKPGDSEDGDDDDADVRSVAPADHGGRKPK